MAEVQFKSEMGVEYVNHMGDDLSPLMAARVSTQGDASRDTQDNAGLRRYLLREGHHVPFEHQVMTFRIHAPIFVTRQILKHRISSISEESGRYRELEPVFYVPGLDRPVVQVGKTGDYEFSKDIDRNAHAAFWIEEAATDAWEHYTYLLEGNIAKEVARMVLPVNIYSTLYFTTNSRALFNFFNLRTSDKGSHPQYEVEEVARKMYALWETQFPQTAQTAKEVGVL